MEETIHVSRQDLYDKVWSKPLIHLSKEYNLSGVCITKICKRNNIPLPPVGYWTKLSHGHNVKKIPLPTLKEGESDTIEIIPKEPVQLYRNGLKAISNDLVVDAIGHSFITIKEFKKGLHPLVLESKKEYYQDRKLYKGIKDTDKYRVHNISASKASIERAFSLMSFLFQLFETNGFPITRKKEAHKDTYVNINGIELRIALKERIKRSERSDPGMFNKYEFTPTGTLYFEIEDFYVDRTKKIWSDTSSKKLEDIINEVGEGFIIAAINRKKRDLELEEYHQKKRLEKEQERLKEDQLRKESEILNKLLEDAQKWHTRKILDDYIRAVQESSILETASTEVKAELDQWITWAKEKANIIDPILNQSWRTNKL